MAPHIMSEILPIVYSNQPKTYLQDFERMKSYLPTAQGRDPPGTGPPRTGPPFHFASEETPVMS